MKFFHSGDLGDIIYGLAAIRAAGGGELVLDPTGGRNDADVFHRYGRTLRLNADTIAALAPLLRAQPYVTGVAQADRCPQGAANMNAFRADLGRHESLIDAQFRALHMDGIEQAAVSHAPWLSVEPDEAMRNTTIVARSLRYQARHDWWYHQVRAIKNPIMFIGTELEHRAFCVALDFNCGRLVCPDFLFMARYIAGCKQFLGNQSAPMAVAAGLGVDFVQETFPHARNCIVNGRGQYV